MKFYIEGLIILTLFFMFFLWFIWLKWSERRLLKKYKPENDKGRNGNKLKEIERGESGIENTTFNNDRYEQPERRNILQKTNINNDGENSKRNRKFRFFRK